MKKLVMMPAVALAACINAPHAPDEAAAAAVTPPPQAKPAAAADAASATRGLSDLDAMTFDCPKAGLNAAAREAAKAPSQGTYQFSYFRIINDAHHASYEVHFKSNYSGEPELKYCVSMYCQQGWDPRTSKTEVKLMSNARERGAKAHEGCGSHADAAKKKRR